MFHGHSISMSLSRSTWCAFHRFPFVRTRQRTSFRVYFSLYKRQTNEHLQAAKNGISCNSSLPSARRLHSQRQVRRKPYSSVMAMAHHPPEKYFMHPQASYFTSTFFFYAFGESLTPHISQGSSSHVRMEAFGCQIRHNARFFGSAMNH